MTSRLVQKHLLKGTRIFEIVDDAVNVRIKTPMNKEETLTVMLTVLNPEPVINKSFLEFTSRVNNEPLLSLYLAKPNPAEFNAFVNLLKEKARDEFSAFAGLKSTAPPQLESNIYDEPPEFESDDETNTIRSKQHIKAESIESAIKMLTEHLDDKEIGSFLSALETLLEDPMNESHMSRVVSEFDALGPTQGAVLTYAPYISLLMSDDPFSNW